MEGKPEGPDAEKVAVEDAVRALQRAVQTLRTYPLGNEMSVRALAELVQRLKPTLPLELEVRGDHFAWDGEVILEAKQQRSGLVASLYHDGLRRLDLSVGMHPDEVERLVVALAEPIAADDPGEDYVTRLWEADLPHLQVHAVDPYLDTDFAEDVLEGKGRPEFDEEEVLELAHEVAPPPPEEAFRVTGQDKMRVDAEIAYDLENPPWESFVAAALATLESPIGLRRVDEMVVLIESCFARLVESGRLELAATLLLGLARTDPPEANEARQGALSRLGHPDLLEPMHHALERSDCRHEEAEALLMRLPPPVARPVCTLLGKAVSQDVQRFYAEILAKLGTEALEPAIEAFRAGDARLRLILTRLLGQLREPAAVPVLIEALAGEDQTLRREATRALVLIKDADAYQQLVETACGDPDVTCRVIALRSLGGERASFAQDLLQGRIVSSEFAGLTDEEKNLVFTALGRVGDDSIVPFLKDQLKPGWFGRGKDRPTWSRAAGALARIGTPKAIALLAGLAESRNKELAEVCTTAFHENHKESR